MKASSRTPRKAGHSVQGSYFKLNQVLENFTGQNVADLQSLTNQGQPQNLMSVQYTGVIDLELLADRPVFSPELRADQYRCEYHGSDQRHARSGPSERVPLLESDILRGFRV